MKINYILAIALLAIVIVSISACSTQPTGKVVEDNTIEIGAIFMMTGLGSNTGENSLQGAELAINEINAAGGINGKKLKLTVQDNMG